MSERLFPVIVRAARLKRGLTQEALAERMGIARARIAAIEMPTSNLQEATLAKLADALDTTVRELLTDGLRLTAERPAEPGGAE